MNKYKCWLSIRGEIFFDYGYIDTHYLDELIHSKYVKKVRFYKRGNLFYLSYWYENSMLEREHLLLKIEGNLDEITKE